MIIENCPAYKGNDYFSCSYDIMNPCQDINDCVMKQIVERLIKVCEEGLCSRCDGCDWENGCGDESCGTYQANEILTKVLAIQE